MADITTLRRAADMIDEWGKRVAHDAAVNNTDPHADAGIKLYASVLTALAARARSDAADLRRRALFAEQFPPEEKADD